MPIADKIRYFYESNSWSDSAVRHCFDYISLLSGTQFIGDPRHPQLFGSHRGQPPDTVKITLDLNNSDAVNGATRKSECDPIDFILRRLTLKLKKGPFFESNNYIGKQDEVETIASVILKLFNSIKANAIPFAADRPINIWPDGAQFAASLTHDIDIARRTIPGSIRLLSMGKSEGKGRGLIDSVLSAAGLKDNPYDRIREWIRIESEFGLKSTYFIFAGERLFSNDPKYKLSWIQDQIGALNNAGSEIGLHNSAGGYAGKGIDKAVDELRQIGLKNICGIRPHYLSVDLPDYWKASQMAGFEYSSSLGYDDKTGFECGIDLPIVPFDVLADKAIPIVEIPIAIMDCGLMNELSRSIEIAIENGKKLIDKACDRQGLIVFDWHQRTLYKPEFPGWGETLFELLEYCRSKGAIFLKMKEIAALFRKGMKIPK